MSDLINRILSLPATLVAFLAAIGLTFDAITGMGLYLRLAATGFLGLIPVLWCARKLAVRPERAVGMHNVPAPSSPRLGLRALCIALIAAVVAALAWAQTGLLTITATQQSIGKSQVLTVRSAPFASATVTIPLPPPPTLCDVEEKGASLTELDWERPVRALQINGFAAPQTVTIDCKVDTPIDLREVTVEGAADGLYLRSELRGLIIPILIGGVVLWIVGYVQLRMSSRPD